MEKPSTVFPALRPSATASVPITVSATAGERLKTRNANRMSPQSDPKCIWILDAEREPILQFLIGLS
jgi:hypothetical protein